MRVPSVFIVAAVSVTLLVACGGCAKSREDETPHRIEEAYHLLDQSENAKAILVLRGLLEEEPGNEEARILLASAYMGQAGVDIYSIWDGFHDVLFNKPLGDVVLKSQSGGNGLMAPAPADDTPPTPGAALVHKLDRFLTELRNVVSFLNRFPSVPREKWILLTQSLRNLDEIDGRKDVRLYRIFIRVIHLRAYLDVEFLKDPNLGTRTWACSFEVEPFRDKLAWLAEQMKHILDDYRVLYPEKSISLAELSGGIDGLASGLDHYQERGPVGSQTGGLAGENLVRKNFGCDTLAHE